jgi:hypothetical protein
VELIKIEKLDFGPLAEVGKLFIERIDACFCGDRKAKTLLVVEKAKSEAHAHATVSAAKADAEAQLIRANADRESRVVYRLIAEEDRAQGNMESITGQAVPLLTAQAKPQELRDDWLALFFDRCRLTSDDLMQSLWAKVLAGEANSPGSFSKRTINSVAEMEKQQADGFNRLCAFRCTLEGGRVVPMVVNLYDKFYSERGMADPDLMGLEDLGLIRFQRFPAFSVAPSERLVIQHGDTQIRIQTAGASPGSWPIGFVDFSLVGLELARLCPVQTVPGFVDYLAEYYRSPNPRSPSHLTWATHVTVVRDGQTP